MNPIFEKIKQIGLIPVISIQDADDALSMAKALYEGGLPVAEITFRTDAAEEAIKIISSEYPQIITGAGTVLSIQQAEKAIAAGAKFIVSPGINPEVVKYCLDHDMPIVPGCSNPTDIEVALGLGLEVLKFFPAEAMGGLKMLKAMSAPYKMVKFIPTGGIDLNNIQEYLAFDSILACGGSWMVKSEYLKAKNFEEITVQVKLAIEKILGFEFAHMGINCESEKDAFDAADRFSNLFNLKSNPGNSSIFLNKEIEINKKKGLGEHGHIAIKTNSIYRALAYLERNGIEVDKDTAKKGADGSLVAVYLKSEITGYAIHLLQKK